MKEEPRLAFNPDSEDDKLYTTARVADLFGVTTETVRDWIARGTLKAVKPGGVGQYRIKRSELIRFANHKYGDGGTAA